MDRISRFIIIIGGGSASGKSTLANLLVKSFKEKGIESLVIPTDNYYKDLSNLPFDVRAKMNFDDPYAIEYHLLISHILMLLRGCEVESPVYDFATHTRSDATQKLSPTPVIIIEGLHALCYEELRVMGNLKVFVDIPDDIRIIRRILRDTKERKRSIDSIVEQYLNTVKPMYEKYILPTRKYADIVVNGEDIYNSVQIILSHPKVKTHVDNLLEKF